MQPRPIRRTWSTVVSKRAMARRARNRSSRTATTPVYAPGRSGLPALSMLIFKYTNARHRGIKKNPEWLLAALAFMNP